MPEERSWNWIEKAFKKIPVPYPFISLTLFIICYLFYRFLFGKVECWNHYPYVECWNFSTQVECWNLYTHIVVISVCILVAYGPAGIQYFLNNMRYVFGNLEPVPKYEENILDLNHQLEVKFTKSKIYSVILIIVIIPFIAIDPIRGECNLYSMCEGATIWNILLDIFNYAITLLILYSMATILWIIFNISWALNEIEGGSYRHVIKIDLFNVDKVGGLRPIKNLILKLVVYQFVTVSLGILSFVTPNEIIYHEIIFLTMLFSITIYFFFKGLYVISKLLNDKQERETDTINELYQQQHQRLQNIISEEVYWDKEEKLDTILTSMEFLQDERERVLNASKRAYDFKVIFTFISTSLLPFATTYVLPLVTPKGSDQYLLVTQAIEFFDQQILPLITDILKIF